MNVRTAIAALVIALLSACGGGGDDDERESIDPPNCKEMGACS